MKRGKKITIGIACFVILVLIIGIIYVRSMATQGLPEYDGKIEVAKMEKCHNCSHENLEDMGASIRCETRCKDCGFTWFD